MTLSYESSQSEVDPVTGGPAYMLSPSLPLGSPIWTTGEPVVTQCQIVSLKFIDIFHKINHDTIKGFVILAKLHIQHLMTLTAPKKPWTSVGLWQVGHLAS